MTSVSKQARRFNAELIKAFQIASRDVRLLHDFLNDILTPREYHEIEKRWQIIKQLDAGTTQHKVASDLHIGVGTVTRGSREMQDKEGGFHKVLKLIKNSR